MHSWSSGLVTMASDMCLALIGLELLEGALPALLRIAWMEGAPFARNTLCRLVAVLRDMLLAGCFG